MAAGETSARRAAGKLSGRFQADEGRFFMFDDVGDDDEDDEVVLPSCPFSQGSSLPVFIQKRRAVSIVSLKTGTPMLHTCQF